MTYLPQERLTILFGGRGSDGRSLADTWAWDGEQWRKLDIAGPPARDHHAQALDPATGGIIVFGGFNGNSLFGDTWLFSRGHWQQLENTGPPPRAAHAMAADTTGVLLFGGLQLPNKILSDTWRWSERWQRIEASAQERSHLAMHFDPGCKCVVRFGGKDQQRVPYGDSWLFLNGKWIAHSSAPSARIDFALETLGSKLILFGGKTPDPSGVQMSDTWVFRDLRWIQVP